MTSGNRGADERPTVGIIGAGRAGTALARTARRAGRAVRMTNSRGPESLRPVVEAVGEEVSAATRDEVVGCDIVVVAVPWASVPSALSGINWQGKTVIDATNALLFPDLTPAPLEGRTSSEVVAELVPGAGLVKAGSTLSAELLGQDPVEAMGRRVMFVSGDDEAAKQLVMALFDEAGFFPIDLGGLAGGGRLQQFGGPLSGLNLVRRAA